MADICPKCSSSSVQHAFDSAYCIECGARIGYGPDGTLEKTDIEVAALPSMADTSLATPTATPVYAERESDRQPDVDTNREPVPTDAKRGVTTKPAPDLEAVNVAGELSDETPQEKKHGGPDDQPRTADLTKTGRPKKDTYVDHDQDEVVTEADLTEDEVTERAEADAKADKAQARAAKKAPKPTIEQEREA